MKGELVSGGLVRDVALAAGVERENQGIVPKKNGLEIVRMVAVVEILVRKDAGGGAAIAPA